MRVRVGIGVGDRGRGGKTVYSWVGVGYLLNVFSKRIEPQQAAVELSLRSAFLKLCRASAALQAPTAHHAGFLLSPRCLSEATRVCIGLLRAFTSAVVVPE